MDKRKSTRRDLRTGAFYSWPMLYGWIYPQLMMVFMIMVTYAVITPVLSALSCVFFAFAYIMYKYQLLYVYINDYQSGGYMWYAVFNRSLISMEFASVALIGYLSLQLNDPMMAGPFFFTLPLPFCLMYFGRYCDAKYRKASMGLSYKFAREIDLMNEERRKLGKPTPVDEFHQECYRQPSLTDKEALPEPYRNDGTYFTARDIERNEKRVIQDFKNMRQNRRGSISINVHELLDEGEEDQEVLEQYFREFVLPLSKKPKADDSSTLEDTTEYIDEEYDDEEGTAVGGSAQSRVSLASLSSGMLGGVHISNASGAGYSRLAAAERRTRRVPKTRTRERR